ncbi:hypothetical protein B0H19DRAFT_1264870 [Mycena capillaripes]|nr:hypothetical protein B0H19DRAFT_1264870 [Mycena capillaripes]
MASQVQLKPEINPETGRLEEYGPPPDQYIGAFFPQAKDFVVTGGRFESITHIHHAPLPSPDFRAIPLGDLYLSRQLGIVHRRYGSGSVRRMYSSEIRGSNALVVAILYEGDGAKEHWRAEISRYSRLRHPNIVQLLGIVSSGLHAAIFHDDLMPYEELLQKYSNSHFLTVDLWACMETEFRVIAALFVVALQLNQRQDVDQYLASLSERPLVKRISLRDPPDSSLDLALD